MGKINNDVELRKQKFIEKSSNRHNNKYDYSKVEYVDGNTPVIITCEKHGDFAQTPANHLQGKGCPKCNQSKLEREIEERLNKLGIEYTPHTHFKWLGRQEIDFYIPKYRIGIECQGRRHFEVVEAFGGEEQFKKQIVLDKRKKELCDKNGILLLYYKGKRK